MTGTVSEPKSLLHFVFQGETGKVGMPGYPGADGVPVSGEIHINIRLIMANIGLTMLVRCRIPLSPTPIPPLPFSRLLLVLLET